MKPRFRIGDRVERRSDVYDDRSRLLTGVVTRRYKERSVCFGWWYPELYEVCWDDGVIERGFLPHGLEAHKPAGGIVSIT